MADAMSLPTYARHQFSEAAQTGVIDAIQVRSAHRSPVDSVLQWDLYDNPDHSRSEKRAVTLLQFEHLAAISSFIGAQVRFDQTRRNLCVRGFNLEIARDIQTIGR